MGRESLTLLEWQQRVQEMRKCRTLVKIVDRWGPPHHKVQQGPVEIWHYPLGVHHGTLHSIHVVGMDDRPPQVYSFTEPASAS